MTDTAFLGIGVVLFGLAAVIAAIAFLVNVLKKPGRVQAPEPLPQAPHASADSIEQALMHQLHEVLPRNPTYGLPMRWSGTRTTTRTNPNTRKQR